MLVACAAVARIMFATHNRAWAALVMPALLVALAFTFTPQRLGRRVRAASALLFLLRDFRLLALLPVALGAVPGARAAGPDDAALLHLQPDGSRRTPIASR